MCCLRLAERQKTSSFWKKVKRKTLYLGKKTTAAGRTKPVFSREEKLLK
jgi:hypothetical protein